ncbi:DUF4349 domain-containing protein [Microbacterium sp. AK031]|uniref:DUF4349 domain-containing protein n=1 Tax=Microbacterium sp. AK031 TaxID=2723076 RepID=UPI002169BD9B|nr:DUF4349 domain-containing protein [Microbacterium sp. AK031]MCS3842387.1 hypothetical protein [Microbacterium sp. AK031]
MNDQTSTGSAAALPELSQTSIERIEHAVFEDIARERSPEQHPVQRKSRRRGWLTGVGIAAAFVAGILITPPLLNTVGVSTVDGGGSVVGLADRTGGDMAVPESVDDASSSVVGADVDSADREIIASAQATVRVGDIAGAVDEIAALAEARGGYVESTDVSAEPMAADMSLPDQPEAGYGWISIRVPSADLTGVIDDLADIGVVDSSSLSKQDVTSTAIDLRARVEATRASVARLTELMSQSGSVSELIEAEIALTDRQAQLESYEQQLAALEDQVAMSSLQVQLTPEASATTPEPDGFGDGLLAGWNGLIVSLNALVITIGFLLPWLVVAGSVVLVIWLIRRQRRGRKERQTP